MAEKALTTIDNPYNPFVEFDQWYKFDTENGYNTCDLLGRLSKTSNALSDYDNEMQIEEAMNKVLVLFPSLYKVITNG